MKCFRCGGKGQVWNDIIPGFEECFVCHGKGKITFNPNQLDEYFSKIKERYEKSKD